MTENKTWDGYFINDVQDTVKRTLHKLHHLLTTPLHRKKYNRSIRQIEYRSKCLFRGKGILISYHRIYFSMQCVVRVPMCIPVVNTPDYLRMQTYVCLDQSKKSNIWLPPLIFSLFSWESVSHWAKQSHYRLGRLSSVLESICLYSTTLSLLSHRQTEI